MHQSTIAVGPRRAALAPMATFCLMLALVGTMLLAADANAASVRLFDATYTVGPSGVIGNPPPAVPRLTLPEKGTLTITLTPIGVGSVLSSLAFRVANVATLEVQPLVSGNGLQILQQSYSLDPGDIYLLSTGKTVAGDGNVGFYGIRADFTPIPLPLPAALLAAGLLGLGATRVRRKAPGGPVAPAV